jgi:hypothetical protein
VGAFPGIVESSDNLAVFDPVEGSEVHRRLAVFSRHDDRGALQKPTLREGAYQRGQRRIRVGLDVPNQVGLVHPVNRDQQHVIDLSAVAVFVVSGHCRGCQQHTGHRAA